MVERAERAKGIFWAKLQLTLTAQKDSRIGQYPEKIKEVVNRKCIQEGTKIHTTTHKQSELVRYKKINCYT